jgi:peptidoglycan/LPS O-acetylase OafA/YrhL
MELERGRDQVCFRMEPPTVDRRGLFQEARYFPLLDGLRAVSIVGVVWHHAGGTRFLAGPLARGYHGVSLFFVLSGFLITTLLLRERRRTGAISLRKFYLRRALRIFPLYYAVLALYVAMVVYVERGSRAGVEFMHNLPFFATYTSNWFVTLGADRTIFYFAWSLATEEQFYLVWPWIVLHAGPRFRSALFAVALAAVACISVPICLGAVAAYLTEEAVTSRYVFAVAGRKLSGLAGAAAVATCIVLDGVPVALLYLSMAYWVTACAVRSDQPLSFALGSRVARYIGTISYGMYLLHMFALNGARRIVGEHAGTGVFIVALVMSVIGAGVSHRFFELPFLRLKAQLAQRPDGPPGPETVPMPKARAA